MKLAVLASALLLATALPAAGAVKSASPSNFEVVTELEVDAAPSKLFKALGDVSKWWSSEHTYSGSAKNLSLDVKTGGCFCENWKDNGVQHGVVVQWKRDELVRLRATLGPLMGSPVNGVLTFAIVPAEKKTKLTLTYRVGGSAELALDKLAAIVDTVLAQQAVRLKQYTEGTLKNEVKDAGTP